MKRLNCRRKGIRVILAIDTSNQTLSIAVCENQKFWEVIQQRLKEIIA